MYVVIAGGGLVGGGLARRLLEARHDVVVIDVDERRCQALAARGEALVVNGNATDVDILDQAGITKADVAVATMLQDADNLAFALLAKSAGVPRVVTRMRNPRYAEAYKTAGVATTVNIVDVFVNQILLDIQEPHLRQIAVFGGGKASIVVDTLPENASASGRSVSDIAADPDFPAESVITGIFRPGTGDFIIPRGDATLQSGDRVFLVAELANLRKASTYLHKT